MTARLHASMPARARLLGALLCLLLLGLAAVPAAHAARGMEIALEDEDVFVAGNYGDPATAYAAARELGVTRMRILVYWSNVMGSQARGRAVPGRVDYDFARIDDAIDAAAAAGIRVHLDLTGPAPAWATGNGRVGPDRPSPHHFGGFARDVARHFEGRVDRYSIWNEPNYPGWLRPARRAGQIYRRLYQEGYRAIKAEDPRARVLIGETVPYDDPGIATAPLRFLRQVTCVDRDYRRRRCPPLKADGYAHHPYEFLHSPSRPFPGADNAPISELRRLNRALTRLARVRALRTPRGRPLDVHLTEFGYFTSGRRALPESRRAKYLPRAFGIALRTPRVRSMLHYLLYIPPRSTFSTGLLDLSGKPQRPYRTLAAWAQRAIDRGQLRRPAPFNLPLRPAG